jgi:hypothetical protein
VERNMIERNLGNLERLIRFFVGLAITAWALMLPSITLTEIFVVLVGLMLIFNGLFSRCYVWYILNLNTFKSADVDCAD